jgi:hypothetical protein
MEEFVSMDVWLVQKCGLHFTWYEAWNKETAAFSTTVNQATTDFTPYLNINCMLCYVIYFQRTEKKIMFIQSIVHVNALC